MSSDLSSNVLRPVQSTVKIVQKATDVFIAEDGVMKMAWDVLTYLDKAFQNEEFEEITNKFTRYYSDMYPDYNDNRAVDWIFVLHTLNFSLWSSKGTDPWTVNGFTGFWALCAAMKRAVNEGKPLWNPKYYRDLDKKPEDVEIIFRSDNETRIPLLKERINLLYEVGTILIEKFGGTFATCLKWCSDKKALMKLLSENFPSYQEAMLQYKEMRVTFWLKTVTLVTDVICFFRERKKFSIKETFESSVMYVDYRVFQIFLDYKALYYSDRLKKKIEQNDTLEFRSAENLEILACSNKIRAMLHVKLMELLKKYGTKNLEKRKLFENTPKSKYHILIDNFLWDYRHANDQHLMKDVLFHNVRSVYL